MHSAARILSVEDVTGAGRDPLPTLCRSALYNFGLKNRFRTRSPSTPSHLPVALERAPGILVVVGVATKETHTRIYLCTRRGLNGFMHVT